eukprot:TRINITY_DN66683_c7_g1_i1.p1 TRINITY_DN66683_c7_g1~~TRINITY_DN66683_c7_g1_i1.p1  ORF type:complete len:345 (+),score=57.16 TRINITY_DN66683_c7_g1_i1:904-1938(+)
MWKIRHCVKVGQMVKDVSVFFKTTSHQQGTPFSAAENGRLQFYKVNPNYGLLSLLKFHNDLNSKAVDALVPHNNTLMSHNDNNPTHNNTILACWEKHPWQTGGFRHAFRGGTYGNPEGLVFKQFRDDKGLLQNGPVSFTQLKDSMAREVISQKIASYYANCWSKYSFNPVEIVEPLLACPLNEKGEETAAWATEELIQGEYKKWIHNSGGILTRGDVGDKLAGAFAHFTWSYSGGDHLVCDLQGACQEVASFFGKSFYKLTLTDPVVATGGSTGYGADFGQRAIDKFFTEHICNEWCAHFDKPQQQAHPQQQHAQQAHHMPNQFQQQQQGHVHQVPLALQESLD